MHNVTKDGIRSRTEQPSLSDTIRSRRLSFLVISAALTPDRIIAGLSRLAFWDLLETRDGGLAGPENAWLRTIESDLRPLNLGLAMAQDRSLWQLLVTMVTSMASS